LSHLISPTTAASPKVTHRSLAPNTAAIVDIYLRQQEAADDSFRPSQRNHPSWKQKKLLHHNLLLDKLQFLL
jgi:methylphosphotriester-DNA--protein-cysteine methyltransferase